VAVHAVKQRNKSLWPARSRGAQTLTNHQRTLRYAPAAISASGRAVLRMMNAAGEAGHSARQRS
jgi:hypothetical protein